MACPVCFFRDNYQQKLKETCFGIPRFEERLQKYRDLFVDEIKKIKSLSQCDCFEDYNNDFMVKWTDDFICDFIKNIKIVYDSFDSLIKCYVDYIAFGQRVGVNNLYAFLEKNNLLNNQVSSFDYIKLLYRGRPKGNYDPKDIKEFFHIPFSKRYLVSNQRFSISGQPMVYTGSSILAVEKELGIDCCDLSLAAFLPKDSSIDSIKLFNLKNYMNDVIENSLPGIFDGGCQFSYFNRSLSFNDQTIPDKIKETILMQVSTFPTKFKENFIPEYVIPQMLTSALMENGYSGLIFPSTKCFSNHNDCHRFSSHHLNVAFFINYQADNDYDDNLLKKFNVYTQDKSLTISKDKLLCEMEKIIDLNKASSKNNDAYVIPLVMLKLQIEYLEGSQVNGIDYYNTNAGLEELKISWQMIQEMKTFVQ